MKSYLTWNSEEKSHEKRFRRLYQIFIQLCSRNVSLHLRVLCQIHFYFFFKAWMLITVLRQCYISPCLWQCMAYNIDLWKFWVKAKLSSYNVFIFLYFSWDFVGNCILFLSLVGDVSKNTAKKRKHGVFFMSL